ncbi:MAG: SPFH domain-containing protein [Euryarchaeota archaeon]|nr:SPFH domain-containing protein [Euryarchaeota archaeon]MDE1835327.1 SPFH domain-containing protein [Euryarchaeota archaeon]MDE1880778.1 SPFH domain-containing protein [Euryarchaeota archaeon]MDE2043623.1 SPFH domain-containing protein [Thermoplasmata archaeon]
MFTRNTPPPATGGSLFGSTTIIWEDAFKGPNVMWRVPRNIRLNDNVVVREDEYAVFFRDGKVLSYIDRPDRYALTSINAPIVGTLVQKLSGVQQQAEVYYLQRRFFDGKFGSKEPYIFKDPDFGLVQLRVFGDYRWRVSHCDNFITQFVGTFGAEASADIEDRTRDQMVLLVYAALGQAKQQGMAVTDLAAQLQTIEQMVLAKAPDYFDAYGIEINRLQGLSISVPDEVQKAIDTRSTMGVLGVNYMQYQAGQAMTTAAANPGGAGTFMGAGLGLGAGMGMGYGMAGQMQGAYQQGPGGAGGPSSPCPKCGALIPGGTRFCPSCGFNFAAPAPPGGGGGAGAVCPKCGQPFGTGKFCMNCGAPAAAPAASSAVCPKCGQPFGNGKFCMNCGAPAAAPAAAAAPANCAKCGQPFGTGKFCMNCGAPRA